MRKDDTNPPEIDRRNAPENHRQNHPENDTRNLPKTAPKKHPARTPPDIRRTTTRRHPKTCPTFYWVRAGSALGPNWVRTSFFGNSTTYRYIFTITATPSILAETSYKSTLRPSKTAPDPVRTQHRTHHETPVFIGCPSCPYFFYIKDL